MQNLSFKNMSFFKNCEHFSKHREDFFQKLNVLI
jgi:hypothetical protein